MPLPRSIRMLQISRRRSAFRSRIAHIGATAAAGVLLVAGSAGRAHADDCPIDRLAEPRIRAPRPAADAPTLVHADSARSTPAGVMEFRGQVNLERGPQRLTTEQLHYDRNTEQADAVGDVKFSDIAGTRYEVPELHFNLRTDTGYAGPGLYQLADGQGRGDMQRTEFEGTDHTRLRAARFTTCPIGQDDWFVNAREIELDTEHDVGVARHARVNFFGVPLFYLPYFTFPISSARKSGFLIPQIGYSSRLGAVLATPYYWNIAPNYDATITPRVLTDRGVQLQNQFRYLGYGYSGQVEVEYLPNDRRTGDNRAAGTLIHNQTFNPWWSAAVDVRGVSDKDYLSEFGDHLNVTAVAHLPQNAELNYRGSIWSFATRVSDYQTVDKTIPPASRPYARIPQLTLSAQPPPTAGGIRYRLESELVNFERSASVTGQRAHLDPAVFFPLERVYGFITPEFGARYAGYNLQNAAERNPAVTVPYFALDSGLFFERTLRLGAREYTQTLEPRFYYLHVPFRAQDQLPIFDSALPDLTFANLFRSNRFVGNDRVGDANQATIAVTTRFLDDVDGTERLRASIGQIRYFDDRRVNIPANTVIDTRSDLVGEFVASLVGNVYASGAVQWNPDRDETQRSSYYLQYYPADDRIVNVGQRFIRDSLEQLDISAEWPLSRQWIVRGRRLYSQRDHQNVESYAGLQYNACCWALRLTLARRLVQAVGTAVPATEQSREIMLELELSGLGKLGNAPEGPYKQGLFSLPPAPPGASPLK